MILAVDSEGGIGKEGGIPWHLPEDLRWFREITMQYDRVIMGRRTWDSLPKKPLDGRVNIVVTSSLDTAYRVAGEGADDAIVGPPELQDGDIVIGGKSLYEHYVDKVDTVYLTHVAGIFACDVFISNRCHYLINSKDKVYSEDRRHYTFMVFDMRDREPVQGKPLCEGWCPAMGLCDCIKPIDSGAVERARELTEGVDIDFDEPIYSQGDDTVDNPFHYTQGGIEAIDAIGAITTGYDGEDAFCAGNVIKYISRAPFKGDRAEDLQKAMWYLKRLVDGGDDDC